MKHASLSRKIITYYSACGTDYICNTSSSFSFLSKRKRDTKNDSVFGQGTDTCSYWDVSCLLSEGYIYYCLSAWNTRTDLCGSNSWFACVEEKQFIKHWSRNSAIYVFNSSCILKNVHKKDCVIGVILFL